MADEQITGRGVFIIDTVAEGVAVRTGFLAIDGRLLNAPAIFPNVHYALAQIEELKAIVAQHFAQAAQVGAQVIASQRIGDGARAEEPPVNADETPVIAAS